MKKLIAYVLVFLLFSIGYYSCMQQTNPIAEHQATKATTTPSTTAPPSEVNMEVETKLDRLRQIQPTRVPIF